MKDQVSNGAKDKALHPANHSQARSMTAPSRAGEGGGAIGSPTPGIVNPSNPCDDEVISLSVCLTGTRHMTPKLTCIYSSGIFTDEGIRHQLMRRYP